MKLKQIKSTYFKENQKYDFLFPIGSTEQHGAFIPFGTDTYITDYLVDKISKEFPELIVLPTLEVSRSEEHRGFYGSLWITEETLKAVMFDICNSLKDRARNIFITSFHANGSYIESFIKENNFDGVNIVHLEIEHEEDDKVIEQILGGEMDNHAGNSEISNMLVIDEKLVKVPSENEPKTQVDNPFETDKLIEKCPNGIADNHPKWIVDKEIGKKILDIYVARMIENLNI
ncbi:MAG: creatininase family protein [Candidatus Magasanikbacteria bacterium]|jgi:creatinine amidohydrolase/Fe(II)-dependent formamide hydrolase-like protein|nr:creatininase family protein [Candidatus Magasanikbacteria bacterium]